MDLLFWWTGLIIWTAVVAMLAFIMALLIRHAWHTSMFVRAIWRMHKKRGAAPQFKRVPAVWLDNFLSPPDNIQWVDDKGNSHIVFWPTKVIKKEDAGW